MPDAGSYKTFTQARQRLDEIVSAVRKKGITLDESLDLYEEAIALGNRCAELVDKSDYTPQEAAAAEEILTNASESSDDGTANDSAEAAQTTSDCDSDQVS